jgi:hypothetical protein
MKVDTVPWRDTRRIVYFVKSKDRGVDPLTYAEAVLVAADPADRRRVFAAYSEEDGTVHVRSGGPKFTALAKKAVRSAQRRSESPPCDGLTKSGQRCKSLSTTTWRDLNVCAMHDPLGEFSKAHPEFAAQSLAMLRTIKKAEVERLEDRLTALLLERFGSSKGKGLIG